MHKSERPTRTPASLSGAQLSGTRQHVCVGAVEELRDPLPKFLQNRTWRLLVPALGTEGRHGSAVGAETAPMGWGRWEEGGMGFGEGSLWDHSRACLCCLLGHRPHLSVT